MSNNVTSKPLNSTDALQILFIAFKLAHIINWPWWQVLIPIWIVIIIIIIYSIADKK